LKEGLADAHCLLGEFDQAIVCYEAVSGYITTKAEKASVFEKQAIVVFEKGDLPKAVEYCEQGLEILNLRLPKSNLGSIFFVIFHVLIQVGHTFFPFLLARQKLKNDPVAIAKMKLLMRATYPLWFINFIKCLAAHFLDMNIAEHIGDTKQLSAIYSEHGGVAMCTIPLYKRAVKYQYKSLEIAKRINDPWSIAHSYSFLGIGHYYMSKLAEAIEPLLKATAGFARVGDPWESIIAYTHLGYIYRNRSDFDQALKYLQTANNLARRVKDTRGTGQSLAGMCEVWAFKGELNKAEENIIKAVEYCRRVSDNLVLAMSLRDYAQILLQQGEHEKAVEKALESKKLIESNFFRSDYVVATYIVLASALLKLAEKKGLDKKIKRRYLSQAWWPMQWGYVLARSFKNYLGYAYRVKGTHACLSGRIKKGQKYFKESVKILEEQGNKYELGRTLAEMARWIRE
ncbi:tetratricopeptide repeat protein, partial [Candidatus Margulisiibacteriota bacterium]